MTPTREELAAFADGELGPVRGAVIESALAADPALGAEVEAHRELKARLSAHFAPILEEPLPDRLTASLAPAGEVVDFAAARSRLALRRTLPRWTWIAGPALAASLLLALLLPRSGSNGDYASPQLAAALDNQLVATQPAEASTRILLSFRDKDGAYCRAFAGAGRSGIGCRDAQGWRLRALDRGSVPKSSEFRQAGSDASAVLAAAQEMAAGPALDAVEEERAMQSGWH